jgi:hypothetical protein
MTLQDRTKTLRNRFAGRRPGIALAILGAAGLIGTALAADPAIAGHGGSLAPAAASKACAKSTPCVSGANKGTGDGVDGSSVVNDGMAGRSQNNDGTTGFTTNPSKTQMGRSGVYGADQSTDGGTDNSGVSGGSPNGYGVLGGSVTGFGVYGSSSSGVAVYGTSTGTNGVEGVTSATNGSSAVAGISGGTSGHANGVYGRSSNGPGAYGTSTAGNGLEGHSTHGGSSGVAGYQQNTSSNSGYGVYAESSDTTQSYATLNAQADSTSTFPFQAVNLPNQAFCFMDSVGDFECSGTAYFNALRTHHQSRNGQRVVAYAAESATATFDDVGTATMVGGVASVAIDPIFGSTIDRNSPYHVFLTPDGDASLYVAQKTASGFVVRETHDGRSTLSFDYRIVARPLDAKYESLPFGPALKRPGTRKGR